MDRAAVALLDSRDEAERRERADQELIANRLCAADCVNWHRHQAAVTWGPDRKTFTVEHGSEQIVRWAGYNTLDDEETWDEENGRAPIWMGTQRTARGTFAAQFEIFEGA